MKQTIGILGVPFDYGVELNNGRPGARFAPNKIKKEFNLGFKADIKVVDYGNIKPVRNNVRKTHSRVTTVVKKILKAKALPVVLGGSHDISYASGKALSQTYGKIGQLNFDAHFDVRPVIEGKINSGTPFRRLIEDKFLGGKNFIELGMHAKTNLYDHYKFLVKEKATIMELDYINKLGIESSLNKAFKVASKNTKAIAFDIDIDGVQKRFAPGCSAPVDKGFTKKQILKSAYLAGKNKNVKLFNLMEVSPKYDVENKTVKLAAELILEFIKGVDSR